jgi:hypothetical protein
MPAAYPTATDLQTLLVTTGILDSPATAPLDTLDRAGAIAAAVAEWERQTGYQPFLAAGVDSSRYYDGPESERLLLDGGLAANPTYVKVGGSTYTLNSEYWVKPDNALVKGQPIGWIEFAGVLGPTRRLIEIAGRWGYATTVPDDAWQAILAGAAVLLYPVLALEIGRGISAIDLHDLRISYSRPGTAGPLSNEVAAWRAQWRAGVSRYRRDGLV